MVAAKDAKALGGGNCADDASRPPFIFMFMFMFMLFMLFMLRFMLFMLLIPAILAMLLRVRSDGGCNTKLSGCRQKSDTSQ